MKNELHEMNTFELIAEAKDGDKDALSRLVEQNVGLVWSIAKRFYNRGYDPDDLFQIGSIGLMKAISKFDDSYEVKFSTYAVPMIIGEIKRFLRDDGMIKVSRSLKEISNRARTVKEMMSKELGREPSIQEIAERVGVPSEELVMSLEASNIPESLFHVVGEGDHAPVFLIDRISGGSHDNENDLIDRIALKETLNSLNPREKQIIILRYFREKTQAQIAEMLGISQVQVSRIEKKILENIRKKIIHG